MNVKIIRSNRKTLAIQINPDLSVTVRAPMYAPQSDIERILREKESWIQKHIEKIREQEAKRKKTQGEKGEYGEFVERDYLTNEEIKKLADKALQYIPKRVSYFAKQIGVTYGKIKIRNQKTRWGSCSSKGNLNFNCLLMLTPPEVIDYVVNTINSDPVMEVEYYEIVDGNKLESIKNWSDTDYPVGCITVYCGEVRLIDNIKY